MAASNVNVVVITGNLTRDPELRHLNSGTAVCKLRVAVNTRRKDQSGNWVDKPNFFDVTVWGAQGENCSNYLSKGRPVAIEGRLEWREWDDQNGNKRQNVEIIANSVQFLGSRDGSGGGGNGNGGNANADAGEGGDGFAPPQSDVPADESDFATAPAGGGGGGGAQQEDDIPF